MGETKMAKLNKNQKETLNQLAMAIEQTVNWPEKDFEKAFQVTKKQAHLNQATLLKRFAATN